MQIDLIIFMVYKLNKYNRDVLHVIRRDIFIGRKDVKFNQIPPYIVQPYIVEEKSTCF